MRFNIFLLSLALIGATVTSSAQSIPSAANDLGPTVSKNYPIALSFNYTAMIGNAPPGTCGCFLLQGGSSEELFHVWKNIAAVAEVSGNNVARIPQSQQGLSLVTYMAGPRYSFRTTRRLTTYGQLLIGGVHGFDTYFPRNDAQSTGAGNSMAFAIGGGVELGVNRWLSVRAVEPEYLITRLPNDLNAHQHNFRISSGVVFRFSTSRLNR
jgi:opacity protein-like surface antigen